MSDDWRKAALKLAMSGLLLHAGVAVGQEEPDRAAMVELQALVAKAVDLEAQASGEKNDWAARKAEMAELLELHRRELALLEEELGQAGASAGGFEERRNELREDLVALEDARRQAAEVVAGSRERILRMAPRFPAPLRRESEADWLVLQDWSAGDEPRDALRALLAIVSAAEQFNRNVRRAIEERDGQEVEVLYLGLARAYYVGRSNVAGVGEPGPEGWQWREAPEIAGEVRLAVAQLEKRRAPDLVTLPVRVVKEGGAE